MESHNKTQKRKGGRKKGDGLKENLKHRYCCMCLYWQGLKDSNPHQRFWRPSCYHCTKPPILATPTGLEPVTSGVTGRRSTLLNYGAILVPSMGLEPIRDCSHQPLKLACLPFHHNGIHYLSHGILSYRSYGESPVAIFSNPPGTIFHSVCFFFSLFWLI